MPGNQVGTQAFATPDHSRPGYSRNDVCPCTTNYDIPKLTPLASVNKRRIAKHRRSRCMRQLNEKKAVMVNFV